MSSDQKSDFVPGQAVYHVAMWSGNYQVYDGRFLQLDGDAVVCLRPDGSQARWTGVTYASRREALMHHLLTLANAVEHLAKLALEASSELLRDERKSRQPIGQ